MNTPVDLGAPELILVRFGELALKGGNRARFEKVLARNLKRATAAISPTTVHGATW